MKVHDFLARVSKQLPADIPRRVTTDLRLLRDMFVARYQPLLASHPWSFLQFWTPIRLLPEYSTGTISLTQGSQAVTGSGTAWTSTHVGHYLLAAGEVPLKVTAVASGTSATIETPWGQSNQSGIAYKFRPIVTGSGSPEIVNLIALWWKDRRMTEKTLTFLDSIDPDRVDTGNPTLYSTRGFDATNGILFEIWPYPTSGGMVRALVLKRPTSPPALGDEVLFPNPFVLELGLLADAYSYAFAETGNDKWLNLSVAKGQAFEKAAVAMIEEDRVTTSWPQSTPDVEFDPTMLDPKSHDTLPW